MKPFIRIGSQHIQVSKIVQIDTNYRKYYHGEQLGECGGFKQTVHIVTQAIELDGYGEETAASKSVEIDFVHGTPEAKAVIAWLEGQSEDLLHTSDRANTDETPFTTCSSCGGPAPVQATQEGGPLGWTRYSYACTCGNTELDISWTPATSEGERIEPDEIEQLRALIRDYYDAAQIGAKLEDATSLDLQDYEHRMTALQQRAEALLGLNEQEGDRLERQARYWEEEKLRTDSLPVR